MQMSSCNCRCCLQAWIPARASNSPDSSHPSSHPPASSSLPTQITCCNLHAPSSCRRLMNVSNTRKAIPEPEERLYCMMCSSVFDSALTQSSPSHSLIIQRLERKFTAWVYHIRLVPLHSLQCRNPSRAARLHIQPSSTTCRWTARQMIGTCEWMSEASHYQTASFMGGCVGVQHLLPSPELHEIIFVYCSCSSTATVCGLSSREGLGADLYQLFNAMWQTLFCTLLDSIADTALLLYKTLQSLPLHNWYCKSCSCFSVQLRFTLTLLCNCCIGCFFLLFFVLQQCGFPNYNK